MSSPTDLLALAVQIASEHIARNGDTAPLRNVFSDSITEHLHQRFPQLAVALHRSTVAHRADIDAHMEGKPFDAMELLKGPVSEDARLADAAYESELRAVLFGGVA